jgi:hypothetical protein
MHDFSVHEDFWTGRRGSMEKSNWVYGNKISDEGYRDAVNSKAKYIKKFGDDSKADYPVVIEPNPYIGYSLGVQNILVGDLAQNVHHNPDEEQTKEFDKEKGVVIGNVSMGYGSCRTAMAMASAAYSMGYTPYWMDLNSYGETVCTKMIGAQGESGARGFGLSKNKILDRFGLDSLNYDSAKELDANAISQKNAELMAPVYRNVPKELPVIATHAWAAQAAIHAGMKRVVNAIPDNCPMAVHLSEDSVHTVQTQQAYQGYRILNGMRKNEINLPIPAESLVCTGHYVDDGLVANIEADCKARIRRKDAAKPLRFLLSLDAAGTKKDTFAEIIRNALPFVRENRAALYINVGTGRNVWDELQQEFPEMKEYCTEHFDWMDTEFFADFALDESQEITGIHAFGYENIFQAVYCTNLLMRSCDVLVTRPDELSFYPVPKIFLKHEGKQETGNALHSAEMGDGTLECQDNLHVVQMLKLFIKDDRLLQDMCENIMKNKTFGLYDGAYRAVELALGIKKQ